VKTTPTPLSVPENVLAEGLLLIIRHLHPETPRNALASGLHKVGGEVHQTSASAPKIGRRGIRFGPMVGGLVTSLLLELI
jgi:hypothetical protein